MNFGPHNQVVDMVAADIYSSIIWKDGASLKCEFEYIEPARGYS